MNQPANCLKNDAILTLDRAAEEAARCLLCHDAPCSKGCPAGTDPGTFIRKLRLRNIKGAIATIKNNNILGGICGELCPAGNLCELECARTEIDRPIRIGKLQSFLAGYSEHLNFNPLPKSKPNHIKVAVIGAGPAGLSCGAELAKSGFAVDIYEAMPEPGGLLKYVIPGFRLDGKLLEREIKDVINLGVNFYGNSPIMTESGLDQLFARGYQAIFIGTGAWQPKTTGLKTNGTGFYTAFDLLKLCKTGTAADRDKILHKKRVAVIGGGDTAIDVALTAKKAGCTEVSIIYRRSWQQMPGNPVIKLEALNSWVNLINLTLPVEYLAVAGKIVGLKVVRTELRGVDASGRPEPVIAPGSEHIINTDLVVEAVGWEPEAKNRTVIRKFKQSGEGLIIVNESTGETSVRNVYAGGDMVNGPSLIVKAVADGKKAAMAIKASLS